MLIIVCLSTSVVHFVGFVRLRPALISCTGFFGDFRYDGFELEFTHSRFVGSTKMLSEIRALVSVIQDGASPLTLLSS